MHIFPDPIPEWVYNQAAEREAAEYANSPTVNAAEQALRAIGALTREQVLARFAPAPSIDDDDFDNTCGRVPPRQDPFGTGFPGGAR
jgi:hypothetical protein